MYVIANLLKFLVDIQRWHSVPGHGCTLECNDSSSAFVRSLADINMLQGKGADLTPPPCDIACFPSSPIGQRRLVGTATTRVSISSKKV
jgi:hypothetical protein